MCAQYTELTNCVHCHYDCDHRSVTVKHMQKTLYIIGHSPAAAVHRQEVWGYIIMYLYTEGGRVGYIHLYTRSDGGASYLR